RRERRARQCDVAGVRGRPQGERHLVRDVHLSWHSARLSQQLHSTLPGGSGQARLGANGRLLQKASDLTASVVESRADGRPMWAIPKKALERAREIFRWEGLWGLCRRGPLGLLRPVLRVRRFLFFEMDLTQPFPTVETRVPLDMRVATLEDLET